MPDAKTRNEAKTKLQQSKEQYAEIKLTKKGENERSIAADEVLGRRGECFGEGTGARAWYFLATTLTLKVMLNGWSQPCEATVLFLLEFRICPLPRECGSAVAAPVPVSSSSLLTLKKYKSRIHAFCSTLPSTFTFNLKNFL